MDSGRYSTFLWIFPKDKMILLLFFKLNLLLFGKNYLLLIFGPINATYFDIFDNFFHLTIQRNFEKSGQIVIAIVNK